MSYTQEEIRSELKKYIQVNSLHGTALYIIDVLVYIACIAGVLFLPDLWMKVLASIGAGIKIANLATIAHDAGHNSLTENRTLNKFIGTTSLVPGLINFRLWVYNHQLHHPMTNREFPSPLPPDNFTPLSKQEFDELTPFSQAKEKFYRMPTLFGFGLYFIFERWYNVMLFPRDHMTKEIAFSAWSNFAIILIYLIGYSTLLYFAPLYSATSSVTAILLGLVVPFFIFQCLMGFTVYVQHTHEKVKWFKGAIDKNNDEGWRQEFVSVQLTFPMLLAPLMEMHHAYDHGAHHVCPAIPCYKVRQAQERLNEMLGEKAVTQHFSLSWLFRTMQHCKLYDYENHCWIGFDGKPTTDIGIKEEEQYADAA